MKPLSERVRQIVPSPTMRLDAKAKQMLSEGADVINLSVGEPDISTPAAAAEAAMRAIRGGFTRYTEVGGIAELRRAVVAHAKAFLGLDYQPDQVVVSNGGKHSLYNVFAALLDPGDEVIIPSPYWVSYPEQVKAVGGRPVIVRTDESSGFKATPAALEALVSPRTQAIVINSPSNPTGVVYTRGELQAIAQLALEHDLYIVSDEIYDRLVFAEEGFCSIATLGEAIRERTIVVNGWSKAYGMTGWRLGYTLSNSALAKAFRDFQGHTTSNVCSIAQMAALGALETGLAGLAGLADRFRLRRDFTLSLLARMGIRSVVPGGAFYVFPNLGGFVGRGYRGRAGTAPLRIDSVDTFCRVLLEDFEVSIVPGAGFGAPGNARISYAVDLGRLEEALERLREFIARLERAPAQAAGLQFRRRERSSWQSIS
jgi:aspartate aminotransferase